MYILPNYFAIRNFRSYFLRNIFKPLPSKIYDVMWGWEISTWRTEHSKYLPKSHLGCNFWCIWLYVLLQKYPRVEFFLETLLQMLKANDFDRNGSRTFIVHFLCQKMKTIFFSRTISEKTCFQRDLKVRNIVFFSCSGLDNP